MPAGGLMGELHVGDRLTPRGRAVTGLRGDVLALTQGKTMTRDDAARAHYSGTTSENGRAGRKARAERRDGVGSGAALMGEVHARLNVTDECCGIEVRSPSYR